MKRESIRVLPITSLFLFMTAAATTAVSQEYKGKVYGNFGYGSVVDDDFRLGNGAVVGGGIGYRFSRRWGVAVDFSRNAHHRDFSGDGIVNEWDGHSLILNGSVLVHFRSESRTRPYIRFGLSYAYQEHNEFHRETPSASTHSEVREETIHATNNYLGLDLGAGVDILVSERISIKPEIRYAALSVLPGGGHPDVLRAPWINIGVGYHW